MKHRVIQSVAHGHYNLHQGELRDDLSKAAAKELMEGGFVAEEDDETDLIGSAPAEQKMAEPVENKMADPVSNKAAKNHKAK